MGVTLPHLVRTSLDQQPLDGSSPHICKLDLLRSSSYPTSIGYETVLFESGDIPFDHQAPIDQSCYREIEGCHILVLIIGGRYGSATSDSGPRTSTDDIAAKYSFYNSITRKEYETAREKDIPIFIFVEKGVLAEFQTYKRNRDSKIDWAHVDSVNVFRLLDDIYAQHRNNFTREFEHVEDITAWLRDQWAGMFAEQLAKRSAQESLKSLTAQLADLKSVVGALKEYSETLITQSDPTESEDIIRDVNSKLLIDRLRRSFLENRLARFLDSDCQVPAELFMKQLQDSKSNTEIREWLVEQVPIYADNFRSADLVVDDINDCRIRLGLAPFTEADEDANAKRTSKRRRKSSNDK